MRSSKFLLTLGTALLPILMASAASAQTTSEEQDSGDEIIVTGTRTGALDLQQAPVAVSVLDSELLETQGLNNLQDMATYIPNFTFARNPQSAVAYIRGVGSSNTQAGSDASVTMQVDGVYIARASGQLTDLFDVERIEVLRGPQGTLYGRNSAGGTINVISRQPSTEFSGRARFTYGNFDTIEGEGYLTGP
ncbi:MAG: TonB-dependent receptor plug domain-containing protein, partial [Terricaulis sp.]